MLIFNTLIINLWFDTCLLSESLCQRFGWTKNYRRFPNECFSLVRNLWKTRFDILKIIFDSAPAVYGSSFNERNNVWTLRPRSIFFIFCFRGSIMVLCRAKFPGGFCRGFVLQSPLFLVNIYAFVERWGQFH